MSSNIPNYNPAVRDGLFTGFEQIVRNYLRRSVCTVSVVEVHSVPEEDSRFVNVRPVLKQVTTAGDEVPVTDDSILYDIPVMMMFGGGCQVSFKMSPGDKGLLLVAKNDVSEYKKTKAVSKIASPRLFSNSDGFFIPFDFNEVDSGILLKNRETVINVLDGTVTVTGTNISITGETAITGNLSVDGSISATGDMNASGDMTAEGEVTAGAVKLTQHTHPGVTPGPGNTGLPQ